MARTMTSKRYRLEDLDDMLEFPHRRGWTDGLPVVPPTEARVAKFLDYAGLDPDQVIAEVTERARSITAEKLAINAVMAGCLPEYMPVLVAALEALTDPQFRFNHLASLGSPWPLIIVNGPITKEIGLNSGTYLLGPGSRPNATIARAVSLVLRNCAEAKIEGVQRGMWGNLVRWGGCIAENEYSSWLPLHVQRGFDRDTSAVTVVSTYPGSGSHVSVLQFGERPERMLDGVCWAMANWAGAQWTRGTYTLLVPPHMVDIFIKKGWSKQDVRNYIRENTRASVASLKQRGVWGIFRSDLTEHYQDIEPGDENRFAYVFKENPEYDQHLFETSAMEGRVVDVFVVVAGGNAGYRMCMTIPYQFSSNPVTKPIRPRG